MQGSVLYIESRIDRWLVSLGLVLGFLSAGLLFWGSSDSGLLEGLQPVGTLVTQNGVQRRHSKSLSWSKIAKSGKLYPKDVVYTPAQSSAEVQMGNSQKLILEPESMVEFDTVTSGTFNVVLVQGIAKIQSEKGEETKILVKEEETSSVTPVLKRPSLPFLLVDLQAWRIQQGELIQVLGKLGSNSKILEEEKGSLAPAELKSLQYFKVGLAPVLTKTGEENSEWQILRWSEIPLSGVLYEVEISRDENFKRAIRQDSLKNRTLEVQLLDPGQYFWRVKAKHSGNQIQSALGMLKIERKQ